MARKPAAKTSGGKIHPRDKKYLKTIEQREVPIGSEEQFKRWVEAGYHTAESWMRMETLSKVVDKKGSAHPQWPEFMEALREYEIAWRQELRCYDAWQYVVDHMDDPTNVPEEDLRAIIKDSLGGAEELAFSLNVGLLSSKIAQAIKNMTVETETGDIPLCEDCQ